MEGPAKSRLRRHLELAREYVEEYKKGKALGHNPTYCNKLLDTAGFHLSVAEEIYQVVYER